MNAMDVVNSQKIEVIPVSRLVSSVYQRSLSMPRVTRIISRFDVAKLGMPVVSRHDDGSFTVIDGQHRVAAMRTIGVREVRCIVLEGLTLEEEADFFRTQGVDCRPLNALDKFNAGVIAQDPHYVAIDALLKKYDFRVTHQSGCRCIAAVDSLSRIVSMFSFKVLDQVLAYISAAWPTDATIVRREMLAGLAEFVSRFGEGVPVMTFAAQMQDKHPSAMLYEFQGRMNGRATARSSFNRMNRYVFCGVLVDSYNKGMPKNRKLTLNWTPEKEAE